MTFRLAPVTKALLFTHLGIFLFQNILDRFFGTSLLEIFALIPHAFVIEFKFWQIFTYGFLHGDVTHILLNMLMLVFIGSELESLWGVKRYLSFYFFCTVIAGVAYLLMQMIFYQGVASMTPMVGASGAIYGLLLSYGIFFGDRVMLFMMLFPMKAKQFVWILAAVEFFSALFSQRGGLSSIAHLGGMVGGIIYLFAETRYRISQKDKRNPSKQRIKKPKNHLKLVINNVKTFDRDPDSKKSDPKTWH